MDSHNLATLFGPNILHKAKGGAFQVESQERAEERVEVIQVVKEMIDHQDDIFAVCRLRHFRTFCGISNLFSAAVLNLARSAKVAERAICFCCEFQKRYN